MAVHLSIRVEGIEEMQQRLGKISPAQNSAWVSRALVNCALLTQDIAAREKIKPGGKGPPVPHILTSRTNRLRASIGVDRMPLPFAVHVGTDVAYGAVHETGGEVFVRSKTIRSHQRSSAFGRKTAPFTVPMHFRMGHTADYPARPYLSPGLDKASPRFPDIFSDELERELR